MIDQGPHKALPGSGRAGGINQKQAGDRQRSRVVRGLPKLSLAVATSCHLVLAARATTGCGHAPPSTTTAAEAADVVVPHQLDHHVDESP